MLTLFVGDDPGDGFRVVVLDSSRSKKLVDVYNFQNALHGSHANCLIRHLLYLSDTLVLELLLRNAAGDIGEIVVKEELLLRCKDNPALGVPLRRKRLFVVRDERLTG